MKVIFLDIDGVLNYSGGSSVTAENIYFVEDEKLILLKQIVDITGAYLVLSSSWRYGWREAELGRDTSIFARNFFRLRDKFHEHGMAFFSKTPMLQGFSREMEIRYWLSNWESDTVEAFVILDDEEQEFSQLTRWLVQTESGKGLQKEHVVQAIGILGPKSNTDETILNRELLQRAGIDYRKGLTYFGQDEEMYQKYLADFTVENYTQDAIDSLNDKDIQGTLKSVQSLMTLVEYVSIPVIDEVLRDISESLRAGKTEGVMDGLLYIKAAGDEMKQKLRHI